MTANVLFKVVISPVWATRYGVADLVGQPAAVRSEGVYAASGEKLGGTLLVEELLTAAAAFNRAAEKLGRTERIETDTKGAT